MSGKRPDPVSVKNLILWGSIFDNLWMAPYVKGKGSAGNMGFRAGRKICVTASGGRLGSLGPGDIMTIVDVRTKNGKPSVYFYGRAAKNPTQEALIYWDIFRKRKDVNVILHGHDLFALDNTAHMRRMFPRDIAITRTMAEAGSAELRRQIIEALTGRTSYLIARGHGFFALDATFEDAGRTALKVRQAVFNRITGRDYIGALKRKYEIG